MCAHWKVVHCDITAVILTEPCFAFVAPMIATFKWNVGALMLRCHTASN